MVKISRREVWAKIMGINCDSRCGKGRWICCSECQMRGICPEKCTGRYGVKEDCYGKGKNRIEGSSLP